MFSGLIAVALSLYQIRFSKICQLAKRCIAFDSFKKGSLQYVGKPVDRTKSYNFAKKFTAKINDKWCKNSSVICESEMPLLVCLASAVVFIF
jgi:hypothetical protein